MNSVTACPMSKLNDASGATLRWREEPNIAYMRPGIEAENYEKVKVELDAEAVGSVEILTKPVTGLSFANDVA